MFFFLLLENHKSPTNRKHYSLCNKQHNRKITICCWYYQSLLTYFADKESFSIYSYNKADILL